MRTAVAVAGAATGLLAVLATAGCSETVWPSGADRSEFCAVVTADTGSDEQLRRLRTVGTPEDLPYQARRYLLDLDEGETPSAEGEAELTTYVAGHCD